MTDGLKRKLEALQAETRPFDGHPDPGAVNDLWNEVFEDVAKLSEAVALVKQIEWIHDGPISYFCEFCGAHASGIKPVGKHEEECPLAAFLSSEEKE